MPARRLLADTLGQAGYAELPRLALERALRGDGTESTGLVAGLDGMEGIVLYGLVAGSQGAAKLHAVATRGEGRRGTATRLLTAAANDLRVRGARFIVAELPDDAALEADVSLLEACGYEHEGRVPDFHRDGVDLLILRVEL